MAQKDALGLESCCPVDKCSNNDYYAGAVAYCGSVSKLVGPDDDETNNLFYNRVDYGLPDVSFFLYYGASGINNNYQVTVYYFSYNHPEGGTAYRYEKSDDDWVLCRQ